MTFNKTLAACLFTASVALVGCNEKDKQQAPQTEATQAAQTVQAPQSSESEQVQQSNEQALNQFNAAIKIIPQAYNINKAENGDLMLSYNFNVINQSQQAIKAVKWFSVVSMNNTLIDVFPVPASFQDPLPVDHQVPVAFNKSLAKYPEAVRNALLDTKDLKLNITTIAGQLQFMDDNQIVVTTDKELQAELQAFFNKAQTNQPQTPVQQPTADEQK